MRTSSGSAPRARSPRPWPAPTHPCCAPSCTTRSRRRTVPARCWTRPRTSTSRSRSARAPGPSSRWATMRSCVRASARRACGSCTCRGAPSSSSPARAAPARRRSRSPTPPRTRGTTGAGSGPSTTTPCAPRGRPSWPVSRSRTRPGTRARDAAPTARGRPDPLGRSLSLSASRAAAGPPTRSGPCPPPCGGSPTRDRARRGSRPPRCARGPRGGAAPRPGRRRAR